MAPSEDAAVHRQLGELVAGMRSLQESIRRLEEGAMRAEDKAATSRSKVHERMDQLVDRVGDVEVSVSSIGADVAEMKPVTDDVKRWKLMGIGALGVTGIAAMALGVSFAEAIRRIVFVIIGRSDGDFPIVVNIHRTSRGTSVGLSVPTHAFPRRLFLFRSRPHFPACALSVGYIGVSSVRSVAQPGSALDWGK